MKVLIVGGSGLISTGITAKLLAHEHEVWWFNRGRTASAMAHQVHLIEGDRTNQERFEVQMAEAGPWDCVIDMICFAPEEAASAVRAFRGRTAHYVFCSTVDVYTKPAPSLPIVESCEQQPKTSFPYAFNKAACERVLWAAHKAGDLAMTAIRPAHTYGEGGRILHTFGFDTWIVDRIRRGMPVIVHADGRSLWSSSHRDDVAGAFVSAALQPAVTTGKAYHVTGEEWLTWDGYFACLAEAMGVACPRLVHIPTALLGQALPQQAMWCVENFSYNNIFDNTAARCDLGFRYTIPVAAGLRRAIDWLQAQDLVQPAEACCYYDPLIQAWDRLGEQMMAVLTPYRDGSAA